MFLRYETEDEDNEDQNGENVAEIGAEACGHLDALSRVTFEKVFVFAPTKIVDAEQKINERSDRKKKVGDDEVFKVEDALPENRYVRKEIVREDGGKAADKDENTV